MDAFVQKLIAVKPEDRQIAWQSLGFTAFLHYGINTFTNREWGDGKESPLDYNPTDLNTDQWCEVLKSAGMTACTITAKHHDGFCLFDTAFTSHSVMSSPKPVDVVASLAQSCAKYGLKLGIYLSPWDRNHPAYGTGKAYDDFFCAQLEEVTTRYGELYSLWFDGACGEGPNGKRQVYDWPRYYAIIRKNQPQAAIAVCGPDVRWIGNEAGYTRSSEWSVVPARLRSAEGTAAQSQQSDDAAFRQRPISSQDEDLGSRAFLANEGDLCWYPAEVNVSIRPGWFYHPEENGQVRSVDNLLDIYEKSVGGNALFLLNIPPDDTGQINPADATTLRALGQRLTAYQANLLVGAEITYPASTHPGEVLVTSDAPVTLTRLIICEDIRQSQRVEAFTVDAEVDGTWQQIYAGTTIGFKKICTFDRVQARRWRITITQCRHVPVINFVGGALV